MEKYIVYTMLIAGIAGCVDAERQNKAQKPGKK
ncbi:hypothetical protein SAMN05421690_100410 [Nitrosomonas sp. Nm51]|nr:hypothetical protein SAMN05421690_100410 [Nitrosomonas sp. Nm51]